MKKRVLLLSMILLCVSILVPGTIAYFTAETTAQNVITTGAVDIEVVEWQKTEKGLVSYPKDEPIRVMPGAVVSKIVTIENKEAEAYVRAKFEVIVKDAGGHIMDLSPEKLASVIMIDVDRENWLRKADDGEWWYYSNAVKTGAATEALFTEVAFDGINMTNEYQNCTVEVNVKAQGVQAVNNGSNVLEAAGWPAE